jgi:hypothetical protein
MPLLDTTPDTVGYLIAGYIFLLGLPILYIISWFVRRRSLERDIEMLESLKADEQKRSANAPAATPTSPAQPAEPNARQLP